MASGNTRQVPRNGRSFLIESAAWLVLCGSALAQESKPAAIEPPDRTKPYSVAPLELGSNTIVTRDIKYAEATGSHPEWQTLDIYAPRGGKNLP